MHNYMLFKFYVAKWLSLSNILFYFLLLCSLFLCQGKDGGSEKVTVSHVQVESCS